MHVFFALVLCSQGQKPEEILNKLVEPIEKAHTLSVKYSWKTGDPDASDFVEGSQHLLIKGSKFNGTVKTTFRHEMTQFTAIGDGNRVWVNTSGEMSDPDKRPNGFQKAIALLGFSHTHLVQGRFSGGKDLEDRYPDLGKLLEVVRVTSGTDEAGTAMLSYQINLRSPKDTLTYLDVYQIKLWYESKTMRLLKRSLACETKSASNTETYDEYVLDADIPDEQFSVEHWSEAAVAKAKADMRRLCTSLATYEVDNGSYPTKEQGLEALIKVPKGSLQWKGPYLEAKEIPKDPWGLPYEYRPREAADRRVYYLYSCGPDRKSGTGDDIVGHLFEDKN